jgi:soluble lytic murein transglycosylase
MMPSTARALAKKLGIRGFQPKRLTEPEMAVRLGSHFLGKLLDRFGHPALALAAYNAGPAPVAAWRRQRGHLPLDAFVEEIPIDETRGYVKRVLRSYAAYRYLYAEGEARAVTLASSLTR